MSICFRLLAVGHIFGKVGHMRAAQIKNSATCKIGDGAVGDSPS